MQSQKPATPLPLEIHVLGTGGETIFATECRGWVEVGRQQRDEQAPYHCKTLGKGSNRMVIATHNEQDVSRKHLQIEMFTNGRIQLKNLSTTQPVFLPDNNYTLPPTLTHEVEAPARICVGNKTLRVQESTDDGPLQSLAMATSPPGSTTSGVSRLVNFPLGGADSKLLINEFLPWLRSVTEVLQSASESVADSTDFFFKAAKAVTTIANLDYGRVLLYKDGEWVTVALECAPGVRQVKNSEPSRSVLRRVHDEKKTSWRDMPASSRNESMQGIEIVVAAPIQDGQGHVIGALYGERRGNSLTMTKPITEIEAMLVELLARAVAGGMARLELEKAALAARVQFEQFFTPQLAKQLAANRDLLKPRDALITVLFCDICSFSSISENLGPAATFNWINGVLDILSECVREQNGVLVDYVGDGLLAMWGAPEDQPDHALLACHAALRMIARLPEMNARWHSTIGKAFSISIGVNTGEAMVGNSGSTHKFKYGPLGNSINLASRVQGAVKYFKSHLLITKATQERLDDTIVTRRLGLVRVVNINEPVEIFELAEETEEWREAKAGYEKALDLFEAKDFNGAEALLGNWRALHPNDGPALVLLHRAVQSLMTGAAPPKHPVWDLGGK